ncbi:tetratricopeptide repeat protein, partial [Bacillus sp. SRB1LM]|uniref:tetratricopeptide repeat protein n=1 Tax=Bacillus sp. SRB1LM TaxID=2608688 RepID=UPI0018C43D7E
ESMGNLEEAIRDFTKAIELKPNYAKAYNNRGRVFESKGNPEEAIKDLIMAKGIEPKYGSKLDPIINSLRASLDEVAAERDDEGDEERD